MNRSILHAAAVACALLAATGCGARTGTADERGGGGGGATTASAQLAEVAPGARQQRVWLGTANVVRVGQTPVVGTFDLLGGSRARLEVATRGGVPVRFELWRLHVGGVVTPVVPVDSRSGFALEDIDADEDASWAIVFDSAPDAEVIVDVECARDLGACSPYRQPGETCPPGWPCDEGLVCVRGRCEVPATPE